MYTESTYTGIALITPMNALTFCDVLYQISSSNEPDAMYTFATGMQLVYIVLPSFCACVRVFHFFSETVYPFGPKLCMSLSYGKGKTTKHFGI